MTLFATLTRKKNRTILKQRGPGTSFQNLLRLCPKESALFLCLVFLKMMRKLKTLNLSLYCYSRSPFPLTSFQDVYNERPLPYVIGTREFIEDESLGLGPPPGEEIESDEGSALDGAQVMHKCTLGFFKCFVHPLL